MGCSLISDTNDHHKVTVISKSIVFPSQKSAMADLKLSVSDLPMLSCHYIQKGALFLLPPTPIANDLIDYLISGLSTILSQFPPLAGRLITDADSGVIFISCNDAGAEFTHASAESVFVRDLLAAGDAPNVFKRFFSLDGEVSYAGHFIPILAVQVTRLADGVFIGCSVNHAVTDGTSFWNFFNAFAGACRGVKLKPSNSPEFNRVDSVLVSPTAVLKLPPGGPTVTFSADQPVRERIFSFTRSTLLRLKAKANNYSQNDVVEVIAKQVHDHDPLYNKENEAFQKRRQNDVVRGGGRAVHRTTSYGGESEISSFQSLCALIWRCVTRARRLAATKTTTFRMAVNCRHRIEPNLHPLYFGNAIQSTPTTAEAGEILSRDLRWCGEQLRRSVVAHDDVKVRRNVKDWELDPRCFPLGNFDGAMLTMGSSPRFPMYGGDFGWGKAVAVRSGRANKFDGKMSAFPGRSGGGSVDVEMVFCPLTMAALETDPEFLHYVSCLY